MLLVIAFGIAEIVKKKLMGNMGNIIGILNNCYNNTQYCQ